MPKIIGTPNDSIPSGLSQKVGRPKQRLNKLDLNLVPVSLVPVPVPVMPAPPVPVPVPVMPVPVMPVPVLLTLGHLDMARRPMVVVLEPVMGRHVQPRPNLKASHPEHAQEQCVQAAKPKLSRVSHKE